MKILALTAPSVKVRAASWDVQPRISYNPNAPRKRPKSLNPLAPNKASSLSTLMMSPPTRAEPPVSEILRLHHTPRRTQGAYLLSSYVFGLFYYLFLIFVDELIAEKKWNLRYI